MKLHYDTDCRSPATEAHVVMFSGVSSESKGEIAGSSGYGWYGMPRRARRAVLAVPAPAPCSTI